MILAAPQIVAAGTSFTCTPTRVWDGDGPLGAPRGRVISTLSQGLS